jgi:hypothetical protein
MFCEAVARHGCYVWPRLSFGRSVRLAGDDDIANADGSAVGLEPYSDIDYGVVFVNWVFGRSVWWAGSWLICEALRT